MEFTELLPGLLATIITIGAFVLALFALRTVHESTPSGVVKEVIDRLTDSIVKGISATLERAEERARQTPSLIDDAVLEAIRGIVRDELGKSTEPPADG